MLNDYLSLNTVVELICLIVSVICLWNDKEPAWRLMIVLLLAIFISETGGRYVYFNSESHNNHWIYNISILFQITINHIMFAYLLRHYKNFKWLFISGIVLLGLCYTYDMYNKGFFWFANNTYTLLEVLLVIYGFVYYYYLLNDDSIVHLKFLPAFWWVAGILLFAFGSTACNIFDKRLYPLMIGDHHLTYYIFRLLNVLLYGFWSFAFICRKWLYKPQVAALA